MSMKEIEVIIQEVNIESHSCDGKPKVTITVESVNNVVPIKPGKTYKLVEDEPTFVDEWIKANPHLNVQDLYPSMMLFDPKFNCYVGKRGGGKTIETIKRLLNSIYGLPPIDEMHELNVPLRKPEPNKLFTRRVMFNNSHTILEIGDEKIVVKCNEPDVFNPTTGFKNAIYRYYKRKKHPKVACLETVYGEFSDAIKDFCLAYYCDLNEVTIKKLIKKVSKYEPGKWIEL